MDLNTTANDDSSTPPPGLYAPNQSTGQAASGPGRVSAGARDNSVIEVNDPGSGETIRIEGEILTAPGGALSTTDSIRELCALSQDGQFLVSRSHRRNPHVLSLKARAERLGHKVERVFYVDLSTLKIVYDNALKQKNALASITRRDESIMQRELIEIIARAAKMQASDIHIIAHRDSAFVRMRVAGVMRDTDELQPAHAYALCGAAYTLADASTSEAQYLEMKYQAARISSTETELPNNVQSVRLQWNPLANAGRMLVMRLLYGGRIDDSDIDSLGYSKRHLATIKYMRAQPLGINIISGPTGSGKSTTLQRSLINLMAERNHEINVLTVEDPPEYVIEGARQMPVVSSETGAERMAQYQEAIRAALRSDPDAIMIGEIRDPQSAQLAFEGAMTGHQIWTSLHANSAIGILDRLRDLGVEEYKITDASILTGLIGQRLVRKLCPHCRISIEKAHEIGDIDTQLLRRTNTFHAELGRPGHIFSAGGGCDRCDGGYVGRTVAAEIIIPDEDFMRLIREGRKMDAREYWLTELEGNTILGHALAKMLNGEVSPQEVEAKVGLIKFETYMSRYLGE
jgi:type II secretory ATPase GspE/PulE/Tfp pilus assembly ATPase PilB-like protein